MCGQDDIALEMENEKALESPEQPDYSLQPTTQGEPILLDLMSEAAPFQGTMESHPRQLLRHEHPRLIEMKQVHSKQITKILIEQMCPSIGAVYCRDILAAKNNTPRQHDVVLCKCMHQLA